MVKQAHQRTEQVRLPSAGSGRSSKHLASQPGHVHPPRGRARELLPETATGVPPHAKLHRPLGAVTPMSAHRRMASYGVDSVAEMTGPQRGRYLKKLNHALQKYQP